MTKQNVVIYVSEDSVQCSRLKEQLDQWEVEYEERNISFHKEYIKELQQKQVYGTPAVFIDDHKILGFPKRKLKKALGIEKGYSLPREKSAYFER